MISAETSQFFTLLVLDLVISSGLLARSVGGSWWFFGNPFSSVFQASWLAGMPKSQVDITIGSVAVGLLERDFATAERDKAASEAPAADILMNLRRLYILLI